MATDYQEIDLSKNKRQAQKERVLNLWLFWGALGTSITIIIIVACFFLYKYLYVSDGEWTIKHDVIGTYGDFIGGVLGTLVALYSVYLLVRTLGCQLSVNSDVMDTNKNIVKTNDKTIYQSFLQIFDNKFNTLFDIYRQAKQSYQCDVDVARKRIIATGSAPKEICFKEKVVMHGAEALDKLAVDFSESKYNDGRTYLSRVKSATNIFDEFYSEHRREMSVHFRNLYLLAKFVAETDNVDEDGNVKLTETDRVEYAKSIRGQLCEGEMLLLRYNCLTSRGEKMQTFINQFNLIKHLPVMSLLEFKKHRNHLTSQRQINTLDTHYIELKKRLKEYIGFAANAQTSQWNFSVKYTIVMELSTDRKQLTLTVKRMKNRPATGSDGTPSIEKALNCFSDICEIRELYKDFIREALLVSNFYLYNGRDNTSVSGTEFTDADFDCAIVTYTSSYPIAVSAAQ